MSKLRERVAESVAALRGVFGNPGLRRVEFAFAGSSIGLYANSIAVAVYAYGHGGAVAVGVFVFARLGISAAVAPLASSFADRYRQERVMLASDLMRVATVSASAVVVTVDGPALAVYVLATATTMLGTVYRPAESSLLPVLARTPEELTAANVSSSTLDSTGSFIGPSVGALLLAFGGTGLVFAVVAGAFAWSAWFIARVPSVERAPAAGDDADATDLTGLGGGIRAIRAEPRLRLLIALYAAQCFVAGAVGVLVVVTALDLLALGNAGVGVLEASSGVGSIVGAAAALAVVGHKRLAATFALGLVLWGGPFVLLAGVPTAVVAVVSLGVMGAGNTLVDISAITLLQRTAPSEVAGRVFGVVEGATIGALALGALAAPALISLVGVRGALVAVGAPLPVLALLTRNRLSRIDAGARVPDEQLAVVAGVPFLAVLPLQAREFLAARLEPVSLTAGETVFAEREPGDRFYILDRGAVEVVLPQGTKLEEAPAFFGEIALLRRIPRTATVRAATNGHVWALDRTSFLDAVGGHGRSRASAENVVVERLGVASVV